MALYHINIPLFPAPEKEYLMCNSLPSIQELDIRSHNIYRLISVHVSINKNSSFLAAVAHNFTVSHCRHIVIFNIQKYFLQNFVCACVRAYMTFSILNST